MPLAPSGSPVTTTAGLAAPAVAPAGPALAKPGAPNGLAAPTGLATPAGLATPTGLAAPQGIAGGRPTEASSTGLRPPTARVTAARNRYAQDGQASMSKPQLLVALYQRLVRDLVGAEAAIPERDFETASKNLQHAQDIVLALEEALDRDAWAAADQLGSLYGYLYRQLIQANITKDVAVVAECRSLVEPLVEAWQAAAASVATGALTSVDSAELTSPVSVGA